MISADSRSVRWTFLQHRPSGVKADTRFGLGKDLIFSISEAKKNLMAHQLWTVRSLREFELLGRFFASESGPPSDADKREICTRLGITLTPNTLFEGTGRSADESFLPPEPDFRGESGRKFWVYRPDRSRLKTRAGRLESCGLHSIVPPGH